MSILEQPLVPMDEVAPTKGIVESGLDGVLQNWFFTQISATESLVQGDIYFDRKNRFSDGQFIHTSKVQHVQDNVAITLNSRYLLGVRRRIRSRCRSRTSTGFMRVNGPSGSPRRSTFSIRSSARSRAWVSICSRPNRTMKGRSSRTRSSTQSPGTLRLKRLTLSRFPRTSERPTYHSC